MLVNPSEGRINDLAMPELPPFDDGALGAVEAAALATFGRGGLLIPDDVRGNSATLRDAVTHGGWPSLAAARGRIILVLDAGDAVLARYRHGHPSLAGRLMFGFYPMQSAEAAFLNIQDPIAGQSAIRAAVAAGFIVRTRTDADTHEARDHDRRRLDAAIRSGAQIVSTDYYPGADDPLHLRFVVELPR